MHPERLEAAKHRHWETNEIFKTPSHSVRGFIMRDYSIGMHTQNFYEINIVLDGEGAHYIGENSVAVSRGDVFIIPPNVPHGYFGGQGFNVYHLVLSPRYLSKNSAELSLLPSFSSLFHIEPTLRGQKSSKLHLHLEKDELCGLIELLESIIHHSESERIEDKIIASSEAMIAVTKLCELYGKKLQHAPPSEDSEFLKSVAYIYENYSKRICIEELCKIAKMSRSAYISKFKRVLGCSPGGFLTSQRISSAKTLLCETSKSVFEISQTTGFYDSSHFCRAFLKEVGCSPAEFRQAHGKPEKLVNI